MNGRAGIAIPRLSGCEFAEVPRRYWRYVVKQPKYNTTNVPAIDGNVELRVARSGKTQFEPTTTYKNIAISRDKQVK